MPEMSDPMTNMEIEDVLSSIRRLVSEDMRSVPRPELIGRPLPVVPPGRLVLTPAFRVAEPADVAGDRVDSGPLDAAPRNEDLVEEDLVDAARPALTRSDATQPDGDRSDEGRSDEGRSDDGRSDEGRSDEGRSDEGRSDEGRSDDDRLGAARLVDDQMLATSADVIQSDAALLDDLAGTDDPDDIAGAEAVADDDAGTGFPELRAGLSAQDLALAEADRVWVESDAVRADAASLEATIAELEAAVASRDEDWEPDGSESVAATPVFTLHAPAAGRAIPEDHGPDTSANPAPEVRTTVRRLHLGAAVPPPEDDEATWFDATNTPRHFAEVMQDTASPLDPDEALLDEDALRELVIEIIRQELQGALGERITRNVRKLVRAEIHRSLASREFD